MKRRKTWAGGDGWPYRLFAFSTSVAAVPTVVAPIETELDRGYDLPSDGVVELALGASGILITAGALADIVRHYLERRRLL